MEDKIRIIVKKILNEIQITEKEPDAFEYHDLGKRNNLGEEKQYLFIGENGLGYHLSFMESFLNIKDENVIRCYLKAKQDENEAKPKKYRFIMINFFFAGDNPSIPSTYTNTTKSSKKTTKENSGPASLTGNILWLWRDFMKKHPQEECFAFSADDKRMMLYSNLFEDLAEVFYIFPKNRYDDSYEYDQVLFIKK